MNVRDAQIRAERLERLMTGAVMFLLTGAVAGLVAWFAYEGLGQLSLVLATVGG